MAPVFTIKPFQNFQQTSVIHLILSIQQQEFSVPVTLEDQPDLNNIPEVYQQNNGNFWVATIDEEVIGTIALLDAGNGIGALRKMFVKQEYRGKVFGVEGVKPGQALLDVLLDWARDHHFKSIYLGTIPPFIAAQRFYEKNGFFAISKEELPPGYPAMKVDTLFYQYKFDDD